MNSSNNYSMIQHSFISPLRAANIASAAVPTNNRRDMSSSPYLQKKRTEVRILLKFKFLENLWG